MVWVVDYGWYEYFLWGEYVDVGEVMIMLNLEP